MLTSQFWGSKKISFIILIIVILGIFFRFVNLDQKYFNGDECITSVRSGGYGNLESLIPKDTIISPEQIERFRDINPASSSLDFLLTRFWMQWFGNSATTMRFLTALTSLLALPAIYWLCMELFKLSMVAWMSVALIAVSPIHIINAQNARPRSLWILMILISSAALLRAIRLNRKQDWFIYGVTLVIHLYTFLFSIFVVIAHGIYTLVIEKFRITKTLIAYLLSTGLVILCFSPWIVVIITNLNTAQTMTNWTSKPAPFLDLLGGWTKNFCDIRTTSLPHTK